MNINILKGKTIIDIQNNNNCELIFTCSDGKKYKMLHYQDCCEDVWLEDICGDLDNLLNTPILSAEEVCNEDTSGKYESATWTFYKFSTAKGYVTLRWLGESNGYYSEDVDFVEVEE